jgi:hypothetical protein
MKLCEQYNLVEGGRSRLLSTIESGWTTQCEAPSIGYCSGFPHCVDLSSRQTYGKPSNSFCPETAEMQPFWTGENWLYWPTNWQLVDLEHAFGVYSPSSSCGMFGKPTPPSFSTILASPQSPRPVTGKTRKELAGNQHYHVRARCLNPRSQLVRKGKTAHTGANLKTKPLDNATMWNAGGFLTWSRVADFPTRLCAATSHSRLVDDRDIDSQGQNLKGLQSLHGDLEAMQLH